MPGGAVIRRRTPAGVRVSVGLAAVGLALGVAAGAARAQGDAWLEASTERFVIRYTAGSEAVRDHFLARIDPLYAGLSGALGTDLPEPVPLRLHPTVESFLRANPLIVERDGGLAGPRRGSRELEVVVPLVPATAAGLDNAARYEVALALARGLASDRMPDTLAQAVAAYLRVPDEPLAAGVVALRDTWARDAVPDLARLAAPEAVYVDPEANAASARAFVQYVVEMYGFGALGAWLRAAATAPGWQSALEDAVGAPVDVLDAGFRAWLPGYLDGGWQTHALYGADLAIVESLVRTGEFDAALGRLEPAAALLPIDDPAASRVAELRRQAEAGRVGADALTAAERALAAGDYAAAERSAESARAGFSAAGHAASAAVAAEALRRARLGRAADRAVECAGRLAPWRALEARTLAVGASERFAALGNDAARARAAALAARHERRVVPVGWAMVVAAGVLLGHNVRQRRRDRREDAA